MNEQLAIGADDDIRQFDNEPKGSPRHHHVGMPEPTSGTHSHFISKQITIDPLNYGYRVQVGCQSFAVENTDRLIYLIGEYLKDPAGVEAAWVYNKFLPS